MAENKPTKPLNGSTENALDVVSPNSTDRFARDRAEILVKSCPIAKDGPDPKAVAAAVYHLFLKYPHTIVETVSDPVKGLPARQKYGLVIADVVEALEAASAPLRRQEERERRAADFVRITAEEAEASQEARDRAFEKWETQKKEMKNEQSPEILKAEADRRLRDGWRDKRWDTTVNPVPVSDRLRANIDAKAKPDYVPLESGQGRLGDR